MYLAEASFAIDEVFDGPLPFSTMYSLKRTVHAVAGLDLGEVSAVAFRAFNSSLSFFNVAFCFCSSVRTLFLGFGFATTFFLTAFLTGFLDAAFLVFGFVVVEVFDLGFVAGVVVG